MWVKWCRSMCVVSLCVCFTPLSMAIVAIVGVYFAYVQMWCVFAMCVVLCGEGTNLSVGV